MLNLSHQIRIPYKKNQSQILENCFFFKVYPNLKYNETLYDWQQFDKKVIIRKRDLNIKNHTVLSYKRTNVIFNLEFNNSEDISEGG